MSNITLAIDSELLRKSREAAQKKGTTLNDMVRQFLTEATDESQDGWYQRHSVVAAHIMGDSGGWKFSRDEVNDRSYR